MAGALDGLRIVDMSHYLAGPQVAMMFGDLGADVIRIAPLNGPRWDHPANAMLQRDKRGFVFDLTQQDDRNTPQRLKITADVVIENPRPGVATRVAVGPEASMATNPRLNCCSIPGFGHGDPRAHMKAWEGVICAAAGIYVSKTPDSQDDPVFNAVPYASSFGAIVAAHTRRWRHSSSVNVRASDSGWGSRYSTRCLKRSATSVSASLAVQSR